MPEEVLMAKSWLLTVFTSGLFLAAATMLASEPMTELETSQNATADPAAEKATAATAHAATTTQPAAAARRPMTVEDLWAMERVANPTLTPDGRWVAFVVTTFSLADNKSQSNLWLVASDGNTPPRRLTWHTGRDSSPTFSPDGQFLAFVSKRGEDKPPQLYRLALGGGEAEPLTDLPIAVSSPKWFPDGRRLAFAADTFPDLNDDFAAVKARLEERKKDEVQAKISENRLLRYWDHYLTDGTATHFFTLDLESRAVKDLLPGHTRILGLEGAEWDLSPDGRELTFAANSTEPPYQQLNDDLYSLQVESGEVRRLTPDNPASDGNPYYTPDGKYLLFGRTLRPEVSPDFTRLARLDRESGKIELLTMDWDQEPGDWTMAPDSQQILLHAEDRGRRNLYALPLQGGTPRLLLRGGQTSAVQAGPQGLLVFLQDSLTQPTNLWSLQLTASPDRENTPRRLTAFNEKRLAEFEFGPVEDITYAGADGHPVQMFVVHPPGFDPQRKWPLLLMLHGGPHGAWLDTFHYRWNAALFAAQGYVVAGPNFHGSTGSGQAFSESIQGAHADKPFQDVMKATDLLLARGYVDPQRLAAAGGSYGGYLVAWILGHTDRFAALINHAGVYDLMGQFASDSTWGRSNSYGAEPWEDPDRIDLWSPSRFAKNFKTPTLILHGELDYRVPYAQGINLHGILTGKGVPSRIVIFPKENHWVLKPQAAQLWWNEVFGWLERFIGKGPQ